MKPAFKTTFIGIYFFIFVGIPSYAQTTINHELKYQLDSIADLDQKLRFEIEDFITRLNKLSISISDSNDIRLRKDYMDSINNLFTRQMIIDSANLTHIEQIIKKYGYPGKSIVGTPTNEVAWYIIQHSDKIDTYLSLIKKAGRKNETPQYLVAKMIDRNRMQNGKTQIYGTQIQSSSTNDGIITSFVWPIRNPKNVNKRRLKVGFELSVEENTKEMLGIEYVVLKLRDIK